MAKKPSKTLVVAFKQVSNGHHYLIAAAHFTTRKPKTEKQIKKEQKTRVHFADGILGRTSEKSETKAIAYETGKIQKTALTDAKIFAISELVGRPKNGRIVTVYTDDLDVLDVAGEFLETSKLFEKHANLSIIPTDDSCQDRKALVEKHLNLKENDLLNSHNEHRAYKNG